jgi:hypothetical protein
MRRTERSLPKEAILKRIVGKPLYLRYKELLNLRKAVEDAEAKVHGDAASGVLVTVKNLELR